MLTKGNGCMVQGKLYWAVEHNWKHVIFTDEIMIKIKPDGQPKVWRKPRKCWRPECLKYVSQELKSEVKVMVWTVRHTFVLASNICTWNYINSQQYIQVLKKNIWQVVAKHCSNGKWLFQDDNAPCHRLET